MRSISSRWWIRLRRFGDHHAEHADGGGVKRHRQPDRSARGLVNIVKKPGLGDLATDDMPGRFDERLLRSAP